jgi:hypothetical protein
MMRRNYCAEAAAVFVAIAGVAGKSNLGGIYLNLLYQPPYWYSGWYWLPDWW